MFRRRHRALLGLLLIPLLSWGCGSDRAAPAVNEAPGDDVGYKDDVTTVVNGDSTWVVTGEVDNECISLDGVCVDNLADVKRDKCGSVNAQADIVVVDGKVVEVICYPPKNSGVDIDTVAEKGDGTISVPQQKNGAVIEFKDSTDGKPIKGDLTVDAERISIIGNGIDKTILDGNVTMASNNARLRGLTITGNLTIEKNANNVGIGFVKVKGNLVIKSNDAVVIASQIFGNLQVDGNGASLYQNGVGGDLTITGSGQTCNENYAIDDKDNDFVIDSGEKGSLLSCKSSGGGGGGGGKGKGGKP